MIGRDWMQHIGLVPEEWSIVWAGPEQRGVVWSWNEMRGWLSASWSVWGVQSWGVSGWSLGFGRSLRFGWFKASHLEVRHHLVGNLSEDRLSQSRWGSLKGERERERDVSACLVLCSVFSSFYFFHSLAGPLIYSQVQLIHKNWPRSRHYRLQLWECCSCTTEKMNWNNLLTCLPLTSSWDSLACYVNLAHSASQVCSLCFMLHTACCSVCYCIVE